MSVFTRDSVKDSPVPARTPISGLGVPCYSQLLSGAGTYVSPRRHSIGFSEESAVDPDSSIGPSTRTVRPARYPFASSHIMSSDSPDGNAITSTEEFDAALERLLRRAGRGGVDVRGSWVYRSAEQTYDLEVMVYELDGADASD